MYPRALLDDDVKSPGETKVFQALESGLDDAWEVFHSVGWVRRDPGQGAGDGEIDFVLAIPTTGSSASRSRAATSSAATASGCGASDGGWERARDPFAQALDHRYALERLIDDVPGWRGRDLFIVHAVALPDIPVHSLVLAPDAPPELILDHRVARPTSRRALERVLAFHRGARERRRAAGRRRAWRCCATCSPRRCRSRCRWRPRSSRRSRRSSQLTREQSLLLARMARNPRMAIYGCAGSGKTMLAVEHAKRLAADGKDVLFVCFNVALARHLATTENARADHVLQLPPALPPLRLQGRPRRSRVPDGEAPPEFFRDELPELLRRRDRRARRAVGRADRRRGAGPARPLARRAALRPARRAGRAGLAVPRRQPARLRGASSTVPRDFFRSSSTPTAAPRRRSTASCCKLYESESCPTRAARRAATPSCTTPTTRPQTVAALLERLLRTRRRRARRRRRALLARARALRRSAERSAGASRATRPSAAVARCASPRSAPSRGSSRRSWCCASSRTSTTRPARQQLYVGMSRARNHCVIVAPPAPITGRNRSAELPTTRMSTQGVPPRRGQLSGPGGGPRPQKRCSSSTHSHSGHSSSAIWATAIPSTASCSSARPSAAASATARRTCASCSPTARHASPPSCGTPTTRRRSSPATPCTSPDASPSTPATAGS